MMASSSVGCGQMRVPPSAGPSVRSWMAMNAFTPLEGVRPDCQLFVPARLHVFDEFHGLYPFWCYVNRSRFGG